MTCATAKDLSVIERHPCFNRAAHKKYGRIHLPVAPRCNIQCRYCVPKFDCVNESRPGVASVVLTAEQAMERVRAVVARAARLAVVGVAGPGDPLANPATLQVLRMVDAEFPDVTLCLSTNGLLLPEVIDDLTRLRRLTLTVTPVVNGSGWGLIKLNNKSPHNAASTPAMNGVKLCMRARMYPGSPCHFPPFAKFEGLSILLSYQKGDLIIRMELPAKGMLRKYKPRFRLNNYRRTY